MPLTNIILASGSPRRRHLLEQLGFSPTVCVSGVEEKMDPHVSDTELVQQLAKQKAEACLPLYPESLIIGADTIVSLNGERLGKPLDRPDAVKMLRKLSNSTHSVYTGVAIIKADSCLSGEKDGICCFCEETKVTFSTLTEDEIDAYVESGSPMDKAGAYGIQDDAGSLFVSRIEGDYYNVVGFPLHAFYTNMKRFSPELVNHLFLKHANET